MHLMLSVSREVLIETSRETNKCRKENETEDNEKTTEVVNWRLCSGGTESEEGTALRMSAS